MQTNTQPMITVVTKNVMTTLTTEQVSRAVDKLHEAMTTPDPDNPNLWAIYLDDHTLWGILDEGAGPAGQDAFTILFPEDY